MDAWIFYIHTSMPLIRLYALRRHVQGQTLTYRQVQIFPHRRWRYGTYYVMRRRVHILNHTTKPAKENKIGNNNKRQTTGVEYIFLVGKSRRQQKASMTVATCARRVACYVHRFIYVCMYNKKRNSIHLAEQTPIWLWNTDLHTLAYENTVPATRVYSMFDCAFSICDAMCIPYSTK